MSSQRFTSEFKQEAVRQVTERGYSVAEVAARVGVSTHSLYKWVKAVSPDKTEQQAGELNRTGNRGGCLVKVKQIPQREPRAVDNNALRLRPVAHRQSIQATVDG